jgi:hypothetical protein
VVLTFCINCLPTRRVNEQARAVRMGEKRKERERLAALLQVTCYTYMSCVRLHVMGYGGEEEGTGAAGGAPAGFLGCRV